MDGSKGQSAQPSPGYVTSLQLSPLTTDLSLFSIRGFAYLTQYLAEISHRYRQVKLSTNIRLYWRLCYHAVSPLAPAKERRLFTQSHGSCAVVRLTFGWKTTLAAAEKLQGRENRYRKKGA